MRNRFSLWWLLSCLAVCNKFHSVCIFKEIKRFIKREKEATLCVCQFAVNLWIFDGKHMWLWNHFSSQHLNNFYQYNSTKNHQKAFQIGSPISKIQISSFTNAAAQLTSSHELNLANVSIILIVSRQFESTKKKNNAKQKNFINFMKQYAFEESFSIWFKFFFFAFNFMHTQIELLLFIVTYTFYIHLLCLYHIFVVVDCCINAWKKGENKSHFLEISRTKLPAQ